jgi:hypothetical protein
MTSEELFEKMKGFMKLNSSMAYIIWSNPTEDHDRQTRARAVWLSYLEVQGLTRTVKTFKSIWAGGGKAVTVPTEDPLNFDLTYNPPQKPHRNAYGARGQARDVSEPSTYRSGADHAQ